MTGPDGESLAKMMFANLEIASRRKVAAIIMRSVPDLPNMSDAEEKAFEKKANVALDLLVAHPEVRSFGDIHSWRHSELSRELAPSRLDVDVANEILRTLDDFDSPFSVLSEILRQIKDEDMRQYLLRVLAETMRQLDERIGREARRTLRQTE